ncbi:MAG: prenyltransferase/squalene oxidase repeat-containing protein [bacterium]|nr:prenyltransferase/squalene oxidase repeat-containing protein [bacterium]
MKTKNSISNLIPLSYPQLSFIKLQGIAVVVLAAFFLLPGLVLADVNSVLYIQGPGGSVLVNTSLVVPESCTVVDNVGGSHNFSGHKAPCAIQAAKDTNLISSFEFKDYGDPLGLFLKSINGITDGPAPDFPYWNLWQNGVFAEVGISQVILVTGGDLQFTYGPYKTGIISVPQKASGGPVVTDIYPKRVAVEEAISFLVVNQQDDGSFGHSLFTDWVAIALGAYNGNSASAFYAKNELVQWMKENPIPERSSLTDFERRAMALMALGINPYNGTSTDYIQAILSEFDGQQFGNSNLVNDDVFALLVLLKAGYQEKEKPVASALQFILSLQRENGSWGDADMSAAAIQMLDLVSSTKERDQAVEKAKKYLEGKQESTGGFGNVYSTSWVLQAISAMQGNGDSWVIDNRTPEHFLALRQAIDGGLLQLESKENRMWATSYAVPAALGKSWGSILSAFEKPSALSSQESSFALSVVKKDNGVLETIKQQIMALQQEVAVLQKLEQIQSELDLIAFQVKAVRVRVIAFQVQQLAQKVGQPRTEVLAEAPKLPQASPIAKVSQPQAPSQDLSGITLVQEDEAAPLTAEAREAAGAQGLSPQLIILLVIIGGAVFVFSGGMNTLLPYLRRTFSKV